jgi:hypothetical protein
MIPLTPVNSKHIFVSEARAGTILPPGFRTFDRHASETDGTEVEPAIHSSPFVCQG